MRELLSGLALAALAAATVQAKPGEGNGGGGHGAGHGGGGNAARVERQGDRPMQRAERPMERRIERQEQRVERQQQRPVPRQAERQERRVERQAERQAERRVERPVERRVERQERQAERQFQRADRQAERQVRRIDRQAERQAQRADRQAERQVERLGRQDQRDERRVERDLRRADRLDDGLNRFSGRGRGLIDGCPPGLAKKGNGCQPPGQARQDGLNRSAIVAAGAPAALAAALSPDWFGYDNFGSDYRYYDGYLLRTNGDNVLGYVPLLGGALAPGQPWQSSWQPAPIPAYWGDYYGLDGLDRYRYYDNVIYELEPGYSEIDRIVALMAGDPWAIGSPMPFGYEVYNVPYAYRTRYYDTADHWYRYADGYVYDIDPTTRLVMAVAQLLGGGSPAVGRPWLASYEPTPIPAYWTDYYDLEDVDRYRYYDDVIYELDSGYDEVDAIIAVTSGDDWTIGSRMPYGYDVYNVPYAYRTRYLDSPDHWYRYSDGYVYDIDPTTRLVRAAVQLLV